MHWPPSASNLGLDINHSFYLGVRVGELTARSSPQTSRR